MYVRASAYKRIATRITQKKRHTLIWGLDCILFWTFILEYPELKV